MSLTCGSSFNTVIDVLTGNCAGLTSIACNNDFCASRGVLCLGSQIDRYTGPGQIKNSGATGSFSLLLNLNQIPTPVGFVQAVVGQTRYFQSWHRDSLGGFATSNFTNGLGVTFQQ